MVLVDEVRKSLTALGYSLSDDGGIILTVETRDEIGAWSTTERRHVLEIQNQTTDNQDETQVKFNLFDSDTGGILNKGKPGTTIVTPSQYIVEISIDDATNGKRLWQAWATSDLGQNDSLNLMRSMVPALTGALGKTVSQETFKLQ